MTTLDEFDSIMVREYIVSRTNRTRYVPRTRAHRIATSQFARDLQTRGALVGGVLAAIITLTGQIAGAW